MQAKQIPEMGYNSTVRHCKRCHDGQGEHPGAHHAWPPRLSLPPTVAGLDGRSDLELRDLARQYRALSALDGDTEYAVYDGGLPVFKACDDRHALHDAFEIEEEDVEQDDLLCSLCKETFLLGDVVHGCKTCSFILCGACHRARTPINGRDELLAALRDPPTTTTHVNLCLVKPDTLGAKCSYAKMLLDRGGEEASHVGPPTIFLSHAWRNSFLDLVDTLLVGCPHPTPTRSLHPFVPTRVVARVGRLPFIVALAQHRAPWEAHAWPGFPHALPVGLPPSPGQDLYDGAPGAEAVRVWNDIFVEDQNFTDAKPEGYFFAAFKDAVAQIGHTVLVLSPWDDPIPLTRAWCLWEIYSTLVAPGAKLEVVVSTAETIRLRAAVLAEAATAVTDVMLDIDAQKAECFVPTDKVQIFEAIEAMEGGFHKLNVEVKAKLRTWVLDAVRDLCTDPSWTDDDSQRAKLFNNTGLVLFENGDLGGAMGHYQKGLAIRETAAEPDLREIATLHSNMGAVLMRKGDHAGAHARFATCCEMLEQALSRVDNFEQAVETVPPARIAISHNSIGMALEMLGDSAGAQQEFEMCLRMQERFLEPGDPAIALTLTNIGKQLWSQGDCAGALTQHEKALRMREKALADGHPHVAISHMWIGTVMETQCDFSGALRHHETSLALQEVALGPDNPITAASRMAVVRVRKFLAPA